MISALPQRRELPTLRRRPYWSQTVRGSLSHPKACVDSGADSVRAGLAHGAAFRIVVVAASSVIGVTLRALQPCWAGVRP